ncbi:DUF559 domain-containing protein [Actinoplanes sp. NBRC 101535]|uniref:endonuclease domain-containing protein n=1 Tax=Actinoplanes sp. NBRC 101535 TaxID=3032196 RepID=UPI0024A064AF|nr:DUF559 domain-containing protein [Actinoplanes sp. NBRC 101535]GLY01042.1 hypothetical protein Acsp01_14210 [Actinoplanes sp. NBRC 101535]
MPSPPPPGAVFRGSAAIDAGLLTPATLRGPAWRRLFRGVYTHRETEMDHRLWCEAALQRLPGPAAIGGASAASLWGVAARDADAPVTVVLPREITPPRIPRIEVHSTALWPGDVMAIGGLPLTTAERTAFDIGRRWPREEALIVWDALLRRRALDRDLVRDMLRSRHGWHGTDRLPDLLRLADGRSESPMETRLRLLISDAGLPQPTPQFVVRHGRDFVARVDLAWPHLRLALEYDGDQHRERARFRRDATRLNALHLAGWRVLRFTAPDVLRNPARTVTVIAAALAAAGRTG